MPDRTPLVRISEIALSYPLSSTSFISVPSGLETHFFSPSAAVCVNSSLFVFDADSVHRNYRLSLTRNALRSSSNPESSLGSWISLPPLQNPRSYFACCALSTSRIIIAGGWQYANNAQCDDADGFDISECRWFSLPHMIHKRSNCCAAAIEAGMLVIGGQHAYPPIASCECYNLATQSWTSIADMRTARDQAACVALPDGNVMVLGGFSESSVETYNVHINEWHAGVDMPVSRHAHAAVLYEDSVYVIGGFRGDGMHSLPVFVLIFRLANGQHSLIFLSRAIIIVHASFRSQG